MKLRRERRNWRRRDRVRKEREAWEREPERRLSEVMIL
jgi:hypothetical protein